MPAHDAPTLVLLPGMDGTGELFAPLLQALAPGLQTRVLRYPDRPLGYPELLDVVRRALPADRPYCLLAESFSGPLGLEIAAQAPPHLQQLVLCCTFARNPQPALAPLAAVLPALPLSALLRPPSLQVLGRLLMGKHFDAQLHSMLSEAMRQVSARTLRARLRAVLEVDASTCLPRLGIPTLYLQAASDRVVPPKAAEWLLAHQPGMAVARLEGPHFLLQANPHGAARVLERFLGSAQGTVQTGAWADSGAGPV
ncbi:alpha/beta fold hydrolase [Comamonas humi]